MNLKALQIFATVINKGTLAKAAEKHHLSESAASRQITVLEAELGFQLFSREKRNLRPTPEGEAFYKEAQRILYSLEELPEIAKSIKHSTHSSLRLIVVPRLVRHIIAPAIARMSQEDQELKTNVDGQAMRYVERWVAGFQFHLGVGGIPAEHPAITTRKFCSLPTVVVLPKGHRLSKRSELEIGDLEDEPFVATLLKQTALGRNIANFFHAVGRKPNPKIEVATSFHACSIVATGFGYTIADPLAAHNVGHDELDIVPLKTDYRFEFAFFEPKGILLTEPAKRFMTHIEQVTEEYIRRYRF